MTDTTGNRTAPNATLEYAREVAMRRKWVGLIAFAAAFAAGASLAVWLPNLYRATTIVVVDTQKISEDFLRPTVTGELETRLQRIRQELMSRGRLETLIMQLDLYPEMRNSGLPFDMVIEQMRGDIGLELKGVDQSSARSPTIAFAISYGGRDPQTVARVANVLASVYIEENTRIRSGQAARTAEVLKAQLAEVKKELDEQDRRTSGFRSSHMGELPQQVAANLGSLERLNTQLRLNSENQIRAMDRRDRLDQQLTDPAVAAPGGIPPRAAELAKLRQELSDLRRQFSDAYPDVIRVQTEIATLERQEAESRSSATAGPDPKERLTRSIGVVDAELSALKDEESTLRRTIAAYEQRVDNVPMRQEEFEALSRDYQATKERYDSMLKRYEEAQVNETLEQGRQVEQFRILDAAIPPRNPSAPGRTRLLMIGFFLSIMFAAAAVVAAEKLDTSFHNIDDLRVEVRGLTLFSIPVIQTTADARRYWRRFALTAVAVVLGLCLIVVGSRYIAIGNERIVRMVARGQV